jgi:hypothetical protein
MVLEGPDPERDTVIRWRCIDLRLLRGVIAELTARCGAEPTPAQADLIQQAATLRLLLFQLARRATTAAVVQLDDARTYASVQAIRLALRQVGSWWQA